MTGTRAGVLVDEIYESVEPGCLTSGSNVPGHWREDWDRADTDRF